MGAIWNFISGKSTDWDAFDAKQAKEAERMRAYRESHPEPKKIRYKAYCELCGTDTRSRTYFGFDIPGDAVKALQDVDSGCGRGNHLPKVQEV